MRAFRLTEYGTPPSLAEIDTPDPGPGELRLRIAACGLNFADTLMLDGKYQERPPLPMTLGMEAAGTVEALGPGTAGPAPGTRVAVFAGQGGLAERGVFAADRCVPLPDAVSFETAAAFQIAYGTSHLALDRRAQLRRGERLVVTGAAGGVGLTAVEIGARMGAEVVAIARGAEKLAVAEAAGATHLIDAGADDIRDRLRALGGADVVYDAVGGDLFEACLRACNPEARLLCIGFASGTVPPIKANHLLVKNLSVIGFYWGGYLAFAPDVLAASLQTLLGWLAEGALRPHLGHVLPLERAGEGLDMIRTRRSTGKIVVTMP